MRTIKVPAKVIRAIALTKSAWRLNDDDNQLIRIVVGWYQSILKGGGVPSIDFLIFIGQVADRYLLADNGLTDRQELLTATSALKSIQSGLNTTKEYS